MVTGVGRAPETKSEKEQTWPRQQVRRRKNQLGSQGENQIGAQARMRIKTGDFQWDNKSRLKSKNGEKFYTVCSSSKENTHSDPASLRDEEHERIWAQNRVGEADYDQQRWELEEA
jgi:hypothetical protein